jgi:hypothetical protein
MKKIKLKKLAFKKTGITELNLEQLFKINGGYSPNSELSGNRTVTTATSLNCTTEESKTHLK